MRCQLSIARLAEQVTIGESYSSKAKKKMARYPRPFEKDLRKKELGEEGSSVLEGLRPVCGRSDERWDDGLQLFILGRHRGTEMDRPVAPVAPVAPVGDLAEARAARWGKLPGLSPASWRYLQIIFSGDPCTCERSPLKPLQRADCQANQGAFLVGSHLRSL